MSSTMTSRRILIISLLMASEITFESLIYAFTIEKSPRDILEKLLRLTQLRTIR